MNYKKESLDKLLLLIREICNDPQSNWFKSSLIEMLVSLNVDNLNHASFELYFKTLKKHFKSKARHIYKEISDEKLKQDLVKDCVKMFWHQINSDVELMFIHAFFQMENMLNYYITKADAFNKVRTNPNKYVYQYKGFSVEAFPGMFSSSIERPIVNISIWTKLAFWANDAGKMDFMYKNHFAFSNLMNVRNDNLHKNPQIPRRTDELLATFKMYDYTAFSYYMNVLRTMTASILELVSEPNQLVSE